MASEEHILLASKIKSVHASLRNRTVEVGFQEAWEEHCKESDTLQEYAACMKELATTHWEKPNALLSRIMWIIKCCLDYYQDGGFDKHFKCETNLCERLGLPLNVFKTPISQHEFLRVKLKLLDVGSCYNPFGKFDVFDVLPIDISPACDEVFKCDFLSIFDGKVTSPDPLLIARLEPSSFDIVVFSLLLDYLPSSEQRYKCCLNAVRFLKPGGLLCIVTPDSKHATANSHIMKKWRYALANLGLLRIEYEKLPHVHCMAFRKCFVAKLAPRRVSRLLSDGKSQKEDLASMDPKALMVIPQDFHSYQNNSQINEKDTDYYVHDSETTATLFEHLPDVSLTFF